MTTKNEYQAYYVNFLQTVLGSAVIREANCDRKLQADPIRQADLENKKNGLVILALVSFIESNFLTHADDMKRVRKYQSPPTVLPPTVNLADLSSFVYLRDCFAHSPSGVLFPAGQANTVNFQNHLATGTFPWVTVSGQSISVVPQGIHQLHLNVLRFYGENV